MKKRFENTDSITRHLNNNLSELFFVNMFGVGEMFDEVKRMDKRQFLYQCLNFGMVVSSALMIWKGLMVVTGSESPIVVVLSGSMEPAFYRGDLLFLTNYREENIRVGEIVVFKVSDYLLDKYFVIFQDTHICHYFFR